MNTFNIYFLYNSFQTLLYVGKTKSLRARFHGHFDRTLVEKEPWRNQIDTNNIIVYTCLNDCDMEIYETYFINKYKPKYNKDLIEMYETQNSLFKEAYEKLGRKVINSCKFNEEVVRNKLGYSSSKTIQAIKNLLEAKYKTGDIIPVKEIKIELQNIYNSLNILSKAKATEVIKYIPSKIVGGRKHDFIEFL